MDSGLGEKLIDSMRELNEMRVLQISVEMKRQDISSYVIFEYLMEGMRQISALYEEGKYFIADLIMARHTMKSVINKVLNFYEFKEFSSFGRVVIATVKDDIHALGKDVVADILRHNCFEVSDLGVDVSTDRIVDAVRNESPDILMLSGSLSGSPERMKESISAVHKAGLRDGIRIIVGGQAVTHDIAASIGADAYSADIMECLKLCHKFMVKTPIGNSE
jgi:trimethylamine corrinoid protein